MSRAGNRISGRSRSRVMLLPLVVLTSALLVSGCVRVHAAFAVSSDDLISGEVIAGGIGNPNPQLAVPAGLAGRVISKPYNADGYTGTDLTFTNLSFTELSTVVAEATAQTGHFQLSFNRSGDLVSMAGSVDLTDVPAAGTDLQIKVSFPGSIVRTDGNTSADASSGVSTVTWSPPPGKVTTFSATAKFTAGRTHTWSFWALALGGGGGLIALFIAGLALLARRLNIRKELRDTEASYA